MFKISKREPEWREILPGVRVEFEPITIKAVRAARKAAATALGVDPDDIEEAGDQLTRELLRRGIRAWEGVGDEAGELLPISAEAIDMALDDPTFFQAADQAYVHPYIMRNAEKNGSSASPNGTGEAGTHAKGTATSTAATRKADAARRTPKRGKKAAPISKTSRAPKRARKSGVSSSIAADS